MQSEIIALAANIFVALAPTLLGAGVARVPKGGSQAYTPRQATFELVDLDQMSPTDNRWTVLWWGTWILVSISVLTIGWVSYAISRNGLERTDALVIAFIVVLILMEFWIGRDVVWGHKKRKLGERSRVANSAAIVLDGDFALLMRKCQQSLAALGAGLTRVDVRTGIIEGTLQSCKIKVKIVEHKKPSYCILVTSDSTLPTVRFDGGRNFRNVNGFVMELLNL